MTHCFKFFAASLCLLAGTMSLRAQDDELSKNWGQWRGPLSTGVAPHAEPPLEWSETENVRWKIELPGLGHSTPIVWKDQVFVTAAIPEGDPMPAKYSGAPGAHDNLPITHRQKFVVIAVARKDGKIRWQKTAATKVPHEGGHYTGSLASASVATDGEHLFAYFGSYGLFCYDLKGKPVWQKDLGQMQTKHGHGEGSSPVLYGDGLFINWDHEGESFTVALDKATGRQRWKAKRDEVTSWATPIVVEFAGKPQLIVPGTNRMRAYDLESGDVLWECGGLSSNIVASPVASKGMVFAGSSYNTRNILAIRLKGAEGDITDTKQVAWSSRRGTPYVPSPLLYDGAIYFLAHYQGVLSRLSTETGDEGAGPFRLRSIRNVYASPVGAAGRIYITDLDGTTLVLSNTDIPRPLAVNQLDDSISASAAVVGKELFLRGRKYLYCLAEE